MESADFPGPWSLVCIGHFVQMRKAAEVAWGRRLLDQGPHSVIHGHVTEVGHLVHHWAAHAHSSLATWVIDQFPYTFLKRYLMQFKLFSLPNIALQSVLEMQESHAKGVRDAFWFCRRQTQLEFLPLFSHLPITKPKHKSSLTFYFRPAYWGSKYLWSFLFRGS